MPCVFDGFIDCSVDLIVRNVTDLFGATVEECFKSSGNAGSVFGRRNVMRGKSGHADLLVRSNRAAQQLFDFGSVARGDSTPQSDVDLMAEFDTAKKLSVLGRVHLENHIADLLGVKVDLAHTPMLRDGVRERAVREAVLVF